MGTLCWFSDARQQLLCSLPCSRGNSGRLRCGQVRVRMCTQRSSSTNFVLRDKVGEAFEPTQTLSRHLPFPLRCLLLQFIQGKLVVAEGRNLIANKHLRGRFQLIHRGQLSLLRVSAWPCLQAAGTQAPGHSGASMRFPTPHLDIYPLSTASQTRYEGRSRRWKIQRRNCHARWVTPWWIPFALLEAPVRFISPLSGRSDRDLNAATPDI